MPIWKPEYIPGKQLADFSLNTVNLALMAEDRIIAFSHRWMTGAYLLGFRYSCYVRDDPGGNLPETIYDTLNDVLLQSDSPMSQEPETIITIGGLTSVALRYYFLTGLGVGFYKEIFFDSPIYVPGGALFTFTSTVSRTDGAAWDSGARGFASLIFNFDGV